VVTTDPQEATTVVPSSPGLLGQLIRFGLIGGFCALVDLGTYTLLTQLAGMATSPWVDIARAISFIVGTTTAFFLNRRFTFAGGRRDGRAQIGGFVLLYGVTFFVAVGVNQWMLHLLPASAWQHTACWAISQATATVINFVMLKWVVFREHPNQEN